MGKASREKGKRGEREAAAVLRAHGLEAHRAQQFKGAAGSEDLVCPALQDAGLHLEVKNTQRPALGAWLDAAKAAGAMDPLILWKRERDRWYAVLPLDRLLPLFGKIPPP